MTTETSIRIKLTADGKGLIGQTKLSQEQLRKLGQEFDRTGKTKGRYNAEAKRTTDSMNRMHRSARALGTALGALGVTLSVRAFSRATTGALNAADAIGKMARQTGVAAESLQAWDFAASQNGVSASGLNSSLERLTRRIGEARTGTGEFAKVSRELGVDLSNTEAVLYQVADAIQGAKDEAEQAYIANAAFGRGGMEMVRMLQAGSTGLKQFEQAARDMGLVIDNDLIQKSEKVNDAMDRMRKQMQVAFQRGLIAGVTGEMDDFHDAVVDPSIRQALEDIGRLIGALPGHAAEAANMIRWLAEEAAALRFGAAGDDVVRLEEQAANIRRMLEGGLRGTGQRLRFFGKDGLIKWYSEDELRSELQAIESQLEAVYNSGSSDAPAMLDTIKVTAAATTESIKSVATAAKEATDPLEDLRKSLGRLQDQLDPVAASTRQYVGQVDVLDQAWSAGLLTGDRYWELMNKLATGTADATVTTKEFAAAAEPMSRAWNDALVDVDRAFVSLFESAFRGFENFAQQLKDAFIRLLANLAYEAARRKIMISIGGAMGGMPGGAMAGGLDPMSMLGMGKNIAGAGGMMSAMGTGFGMAAQNIGAAGYFGAAGANLSMAGSSAMAGAWGTAIGAAAPYLLPALAIGVIAASGLFGRKHKESGIMGTFAGGDVTANQYDFYKGGMFRSNKTKIGDSDPAFAERLRQLQAGTARMVETLGMGGDAVRDFAGEVKINLKGLSQEEAVRKIQEEFFKLQGTMAGTVPGIENFRYAGETAGEAFQRLAEETYAMMEGLGITTESLADIILGGMTGRLTEAQVGEQLADVVIGGVYNAIASQYATQVAEVFQSQIITPIFTAIMAGVPISQAISQSAIASVVETARSAAAAINSIFSDPGFRAAIGSINQAIGSIAGATGSIRVPSFRAARISVPKLSAPKTAERDTVGDERKRLEMELLRLRGDEVAIRRIERAELHSSNRALYDRIQRLQDEQARMQERQGLEMELLRLRGDEAAIRRIERADLHWSNRALYNRIKALEDEQRALEQLRAASQSVVDEINRLRGQETAQSEAALLSRFAITSAQARAGDLDALQRLPELSRMLEESAMLTAGSYADIARMRMWMASSMADTLKRLGIQDIPQFAAGGMHSGGARLVGERGPELEVTGPSRIFSAADTERMFNRADPEVVREIRRLHAELAAARALQMTATRNSVQLLRQIKRWDVDGMPTVREEETA